MRYMLDTNTCIFIMKKQPSVIENYNANKHCGICISSIALAELEYGICNSDQIERNHEKLFSFLEDVDVLDFGVIASAEYGRVKYQLKHKIIGYMDMLIAAHALSERLILVTDNTREFGRVTGLGLENWKV